MRAFRVIFLAYLAWMLVVFLPAHTRGRITMGPRPAPAAAQSTAAESCCESDDVPKTPTSKDRAQCAVCFWAAGILPAAPFVFHVVLVEQSLERARAYAAQVRAIACRLNHFGRDPPLALA